MKFSDYFWEHPSLKPYERQFDPGQELFKQGDAAQSLFILTRGIAKLVATDEKGMDHPIAFLEAGEMLGEQTVFQAGSHAREFGATAVSPLQCIELTGMDLDQIENEHPEVGMDLLRAITQLSTKRLSRTNQLCLALACDDAMERCKRLIRHLAQWFGRSPKHGSGTEVLLLPEMLSYYLGAPEKVVSDRLAVSCKEGWLAPLGNHSYLVLPTG